MTAPASLSPPASTSTSSPSSSTRGASRRGSAPKLSAGKVTYPGEKSVRRVEEDGEYVRDVLGRRGEDGPGRELLFDVYLDGELVDDLPSLDDVRDRRAREVGRLPEAVLEIEEPSTYPIEVSDGLERLTREVHDELVAQVGD